MPSLESYKLATISKLKRRELQSLAKRYHIKANSKNIVLVKHLEAKWREIHEITDYEDANTNHSNKENESTQNTNNNHQSAAETPPEPELQPKPRDTAEPLIVIDASPKVKEPPFVPPAAPAADTDTAIAAAPCIQMVTDSDQNCTEDKASRVYDDGDCNYNANPNGNNGSFVEIEDESPLAAPIQLHSITNEIESQDSSTTYTTHNNMNNGSMIDITTTADADADGDTLLNDSLSITPKLDKATQEFIRRSLNPEYKEENTHAADTNNANNRNEAEAVHVEDGEDVEMESTPYDESERVIYEAPMQRTPMLSVPASRVTVDDSEDITMDDITSNESEGSPPNWKETPLKALQILNSIQNEISMEASSKSEADTDTNPDADATEEDTQLELSFESTSQSEDKTETETETTKDTVRGEISFISQDTKSNIVDNLFYHSPMPPARASPKDSACDAQHIVEPKSEIIHKNNVRKISMTFGDGQVFAFKSVYSNSNCNSAAKRRKSTSALRVAQSPETETLCEKTMAIRRMMEEEEEKQEMKIDSKARGAPDWNAIHNKQIFSRQPDLSQWDAQRKERSERLFGASGQKMSTPSYRHRSKSMIGGKGANAIAKTGQSEKRGNKKRAVMVPSSNDHRFNHNQDSKLNTKVVRQPTPYKRNVLDPKARNQKASQKPRFSAFGASESESISEEKVVKVPKNKLAFDPDKVKSRLFEATGASASKSKKKRNRAQTPQVISRSNPKNKVMANKFKNLSKNWSEIKSKIDTNNSSKSESNSNKKASSSVCGIKRKLSWSVNKQKSETRMRQPQQKKRRLTDISSTRKWQK